MIIVENNLVRCQFNIFLSGTVINTNFLKYVMKKKKNIVTLSLVERFNK